MIYTSSNGKFINACNCRCHNHGSVVRHMVACCEVTYKKYMTDRGIVIPSEVQRAVDEVAGAAVPA